MKMNEACGVTLSRLGFGCMRLPLTADSRIDDHGKYECRNTQK